MLPPDNAIRNVVADWFCCFMTISARACEMDGGVKIIFSLCILLSVEVICEWLFVVIGRLTVREFSVFCQSYRVL